MKGAGAPPPSKACPPMRLRYCGAAQLASQQAASKGKDKGKSKDKGGGKTGASSSSGNLPIPPPPPGSPPADFLALGDASPEVCMFIFMQEHANARLSVQLQR